MNKDREAVPKGRRCQTLVGSLSTPLDLKGDVMPHEEIRVALDLSEAVALIEQQQEEIAALNRIIDTQVSAQTACPVCSGDGRTISGMLCVCNGSGKITDAYDYLRKYNLELEKQIAGLEKTASEQDNCILHFQTRVAALKAEIEKLKFGREPLPCPRADK